MVFSEDRDPSNPPAGPADPELGYWFFEEPDGGPIALVTSFSVHNHVVGGSPVAGRPPPEVFHRDLGGRLGDVVREARLGSDIPTVYLAGASGDTSWQDPNIPPPFDGEAAAWKIGSALADAVISHAGDGDRRPIKDLQFANRVMDIPDRPLSESRFCDDYCRGRGEGMQEFDQVRWRAEEKAIRELGATSCEVEVGAISMSGTAISTNPAELFVEFGLEIKERSPFEVTLISELANGWCGYVPTEAAFTEGGYETHRSVRVSRLDTQAAGRTITDACVEIFGRLSALGRLDGRHDGQIQPGWPDLIVIDSLLGNAPLRLVPYAAAGIEIAVVAGKVATRYFDPYAVASLEQVARIPHVYVEFV